jgi:hypothetical protein
MGQEIRGIPEDPPLNRPPVGARAASGGEDAARELSIGRYLAGQRRLRGVSIDELADRTRIPRRSLERLEDGAFDQQADGFARGFVRTVAQALGLNVDEAVMRLLEEPPSGDEDLAYRRDAAWRWAVASALLVGVSAAVFGLWSLLGGASEPAEQVSREILYRRDAVRALAEEQRASVAGSESLDSEREGDPD